MFGLGGWKYWPFCFAFSRNETKSTLANQRFARYGQRKAITKREFAHDAVKLLLRLRNSCEVTVTFYFRIPRNTLCLSPGFRIRFDPCWIPRRGFRILCPWNLDSRYQSSVDSRFLELYSRFQSPRFLILQAKISRILDYASKKSWIPQSVFPYLGRISYCFSNAPENMPSGSQEHLKIKSYAIFLFLEWIVADSNWINGSGSCEVKRALKTTFVHLVTRDKYRPFTTSSGDLMPLPLTFNVRQRYFLISICATIKGVIKYVWDSSQRFWQRCGKMCLRFKSKARLKCR